jgi:hypothetical protein
MDIKKADEMAKRCNVSAHPLQLLCQNGNVEGASKFGNAWASKRTKPTRKREYKLGRKPKEYKDE